MRIYGDQKGSVSFNSQMDTQLHGNKSMDGNTLFINGHAPVHVDNYNKKKEIEWDDSRGMGF